MVEKRDLEAQTPSEGKNIFLVCPCKQNPNMGKPSEKEDIRSLGGVAYARTMRKTQVIFSFTVFFPNKYGHTQSISLLQLSLGKVI